MKNYRHDPGKTIDYGYDWTSWLSEGDTIDEVTVTTDPVSGPVASGAAVLDAGRQVACKVETTVDCKVTFHITTVNGLTDDRTIRLVVLNR